MKTSRPWLYLSVLSVVICFALAVVYLFSIKKVIRPFTMPVLKDTLGGQAFVLYVTEAQADIYQPLYMGKWRPSLTVGHPIYPYAYHFDEFMPPSRYRPGSIRELQLLVDTTQYITDYRESWNTGGVRHHAVKSYPVMLANLSADTLYVGTESSFSFRQEALDSTGKWKPVEGHFIYACGVGLSGIYLPPGEMVIVAAPLYQGSYRTRMRIRYGNVVSQEFAGSINPQQFNVRWP